MTELLGRILQDKRQTRQRHAALPVAEKLRLLERLRDRSLLLATSPLRQPLLPTRGTTSPESTKQADGSPEH